MKIRVSVSTNLVGSETETELEFDEEEAATMTEEDFESAAREAMFEMIEWNWKRID